MVPEAADTATPSAATTAPAAETSVAARCGVSCIMHAATTATAKTTGPAPCLASGILCRRTTSSPKAGMATGRTVPYAVPAYGDRSPIAADGPVGRKGDVIDSDQACRGINGSSHPRTTTTGGMHANKIPVTAMATLGYTVTQGEVPDGDIATGDLEDASRIATANGNVFVPAIDHDILTQDKCAQRGIERNDLICQIV